MSATIAIEGNAALVRNTVHIGDARQMAARLAANSVQSIVTSPPYYGLRSYLDAAHPHKPLEMGSEPTLDAFVAEMVALFAALRPALRDDGTLWLNLGDSYANLGGAGRQGNGQRADRTFTAEGLPKRGESLGEKQLMGVPWRVALALQSDGWVLRSDIVWSKPNPMPESVRDRPTRSHEYLFLLTKRPRYYYDAEAISEDVTGGTHPKGPKNAPPKSLQHADARAGVKNNASFTAAIPDVVSRRNKRSVWTVTPAAFPGAHFATFPPDLVRPCILAGTSEKGACAACGAPWRRVVERESSWSERKATGATAGNIGVSETYQNGVHGEVRHHYLGGGESKTLGWEPSCDCGTTETRPCLALDPFNGSGTVAYVATELGRDWLGFDLDERAIAWTAGRLATVQRALPLAGG